MYNPQPFKITDLAVLDEFISENGFATLISRGTDYPLASHLPLIAQRHESQQILVGHISRANEQVKFMEKDPNVTVVFQGPHTYIPSHAKDPEALSILPTWDYQVVHVTGKLSFVSDESMLESLHNLMQHFESSQPKRLELADFPQDQLEKKMKAIVGFRIRVEACTGCFRLNQNRPAATRENIRSYLEDGAQPYFKDLREAIGRFND